MEVNPKNIKKVTKTYQKKISDIIKNCDKKKYKTVPDSELLEVLSMAKSINDKKEILNLYNNYKNFISEGVKNKVEDFLGIKKEVVKKRMPEQEADKQEVKPEIEDILAAKEAFYSVEYELLDELPQETIELLNHYKEEGFVFSTMKKYKVYSNDKESRAISNADKRSPVNIAIFWSNEKELSIVIGQKSEKLTVLQALEKYHDNKYFMMHLNYLLGLYLYTPSNEYFNGNEIAKEKSIVRVLK